MFAAFFYLLRARGLDVSLNEWLTLLEGMEKGLHGSTLTGFYFLCRAIVVKSEAEYDRFDQAFAEFFKDVSHKGELPEELLEWLNHPSEDLRRSLEELKRRGGEEKSLVEIEEMLRRRLEEQREEHNGGTYWVGTQGSSVFGNGGWRPNSLRVGGQGQRRAALAVAGERRFRDFRRDTPLETRQFQMAFRLLRQLSAQARGGEKVLDVEGTVRATGDNGGLLQVRYKPPRRNTIKVLLLMDCGGSMDEYARLCSTLFRAAAKANTFQELHTYYFHNCIYGAVYRHPWMRPQDRVETEWLLQNFDGACRVLVVGDAAMNPDELWQARYDWRQKTAAPSGMEWLQRLRRHFPYLVWLNPEPTPTHPHFWGQTHLELAKLFPMYDLSAQGLETAVRRLMVK